MKVNKLLRLAYLFSH